MSTNIENSDNSNVPKLLTVNDIAKLLKLSTRSVWRLVKAKTIVEPIRIGGSIRWRPSDVATWIASIPQSERSLEDNLMQNQVIDRQDHATIQSGEPS